MIPNKEQLQIHIGNQTTCVVVSKGHGIETVQQAYNQGHQHFGENYLQEALPKITALPHATWHFIGTLQSNKTKIIAQHFDWVQTLCSQKQAQRLSIARADLAPLQVCIQITLDHRQRGICVDRADALMTTIHELPNLKLRGLFYKPPIDLPTQTLTQHFVTLSDYFKHQQRHYDLDTLCMGMSSDFHHALKHGANMVRLGTYILGPRPGVH